MRTIPSAVRRGLHFGMLEGAVVAAMFVCMEAWMVPLLQTRLGAAASIIGLLTFIPQVGIVTLAPWAGEMIRRLGGNKRAAILICWVQTTLIAAMMLPLHCPDSAWAVPFATACICIFGLTGVITGPAWVAWMGDLIPGQVRGSYQAQRARLFHICKLAFAAAFMGIMHLWPALHSGWGLQIVIAVAILSRIASTWCLTQQPEPMPRPRHASVPLSSRSRNAAVGLPGFLRTIHTNDLGRWTLVWSIFHFGVASSGPFFASYMVATQLQGGLGLAEAPTWYTVLIYTSAVSRIIAYPLVGRIIDLYGPQAVLRVALCIIMVIPIAWATTSNLWVLIADEAIAGMAWAAAECAVGSLLFGCHSDRQRRAELIGYHVTVASTMVALGSLVGILLIDRLPPLWGSAYHTLFLISVALRVPGVLLALRWLPPLRDLSHTERADLWQRIPGAAITNSLGRGLIGIFRRPEG